MLHGCVSLHSLSPLGPLSWNDMWQRQHKNTKRLLEGAWGRRTKGGWRHRLRGRCRWTNVSGWQLPEYVHRRWWCRRRRCPQGSPTTLTWGDHPAPNCGRNQPLLACVGRAQSKGMGHTCIWGCNVAVAAGVYRGRERGDEWKKKKEEEECFNGRNKMTLSTHAHHDVKIIC